MSAFRTGVPPSRRTVLRATAALPLALAMPAIATSTTARAAAAPLTLGVLTPLTGAGSFDGPRMLKAIQAVADEVNAAGGVDIGQGGQQIKLIVEDDQTNPDDAVRAAHKLVDIDRVPAIIGTWASAVTTAVAPVCWESKTFIATVSGADSITQLPHQGYLIRTQPNTKLQATAHGQFILSLGAKKVFVLGIQSPMADSVSRQLAATLKAGGGEVSGALVYEKDKTSYRTEIDQALRGKPDLIYLNGYAPDTAVLLRDLYRAGYEGLRFTQSYALTTKQLAALPQDVTEGVYTGQPSADLDSPAYAALSKRLNNPSPDSYEAQANDWISLILLTAARAKAATGTALKDNVRRISQGDGMKVYTALDGLKALAAGHEINYEGASGPCDFDAIGDILTCKFRFQKVEKGALVTVKLA
jgi:branched-chain amino acid transport system substrate-binding protein